MATETDYHVSWREDVRYAMCVKAESEEAAIALVLSGEVQPDDADHNIDHSSFYAKEL